MKLEMMLIVVAAVAHSVLSAAVSNPDSASIETLESNEESFIDNNIAPTDLAVTDEINQDIERLEQRIESEESEDESSIENNNVNSSGIFDELQSTDCPRGFTYSSQARMCYMVVTVPANNWSQAQAACSDGVPGAHLAVLRTIDETQGLTDYLKRFKSHSELQHCKTEPNARNAPIVYIGGQRVINNDCNSPFVWKPTSHLQFQMTYSNWHIHEPNCASISGRTRESCATIRTERGEYTWNDLSCEIPGCYVCQYTDNK